MNKILNGIKRMLFGSTTFFTGCSGSGVYNGTSFVEIYKGRNDYPIKIIGIKFNSPENSFGEWRITTASHGKIFPFDDVNPLTTEYHNIIPIEIEAGELVFVEVRSRDANVKAVIILEELTIIEMR